MTLREHLNQLDNYAIDNDKKYFDLVNLYESVVLDYEDKKKLKELIDKNEDPEVISAFLDAKSKDAFQESFDDTSDFIIDLEDNGFDVLTLDELKEIDAEEDKEIIDYMEENNLNYFISNPSMARFWYARSLEDIKHFFDSGNKLSYDNHGSILEAVTFGQEPSSFEYGQAMNQIAKDEADFLKQNDIKKDSKDESFDRWQYIYTGSIDNHSFEFVKSHTVGKSWPSSLIIDGKKIDLYKSYENVPQYYGGTWKEYLYHGLTIYDVVKLIRNPDLYHIQYRATESLKEDWDSQEYQDAESIQKYVESKRFMNSEISDYENGPMNMSIVTFFIEGDWKHDHLRFDFLVKEWAEQCGKNIFKIDHEIVSDTESDYYDARHIVYVVDNQDTMNQLNSMKKLFVTESKNLKEGTSKKRVAHFKEFDNGHVLHNWKSMSEEEAQEEARLASIKDPSDAYYVAYDDIMSNGTDIYWCNGKLCNNNQARKYVGWN